MAQKHLKLPETTVYRKINNELVVVQLDTAHFYYFNPETEALLQFFRTPSTVEQLLASAELASKEAISEIKTFCQSLLEKKILSETEDGTEITDHAHRPLWVEKENLHPRLLREGEKTIDQISFACP